MKFTGWSVLAFLGIMANAIPALTEGGVWADTMFPIVNYGFMIILTVVALVLRRRKKLADLETGAVMLSVLGIFALMLGLAISVAMMAHNKIKFTDDKFDFMLIAIPGIEGLVAVGLGAWIGGFLRTIEDDYFASPAGAAGPGVVPSGPAAVVAMGITPATAIAMEESAKNCAAHFDAISNRLASVATKMSMLDTLLEQVGRLIQVCKGLFGSVSVDPRDPPAVGGP